MNPDRVSQPLFLTFLDELDELVGVFNADLRVLATSPADPERLRSLFRVAHTLKGAARVAGVPPIERTCHALQTLLAEAREGRIAIGAVESDFLMASAAALADAGIRLRNGRDLDDSPITVLLRRTAQVAGGDHGNTHPRR